VRWLSLACALQGALVALALTGCESSQEKSAKLEREAKLHLKQVAETEVTITRPSTRVQATSESVVTSSEGSAAVVMLHNSSAAALADVPILITVRDAQGATVYTNKAPGLTHTLVSAALIPAHSVLMWIDDQVQASGTAAPATASAEVGEGRPAINAIPEIVVSGAHLTEGGAEGTVTNRSAVAQRELVINAIARRAGRVLAAGRAVLPSLPGAGSLHFQVFLIGSLTGAQLQVSAPATTPG